MHASSTDDMLLLREAARTAGEIALGYFGREPETWRKDGGSPVTEADSGRVRVDILIENDDGNLRSGVLCRLNLSQRAVGDNL